MLKVISLLKSSTLIKCIPKYLRLCVLIALYDVWRSVLHDLSLVHEYVDYIHAIIINKDTLESTAYVIVFHRNTKNAKYTQIRMYNNMILLTIHIATSLYCDFYCDIIIPHVYLITHWIKMHDRWSVVQK